MPIISSSPLIRLHHATVLRGGRYVLNDLDWELHPGQHWCLTGENGAGKSTFLQLLRGELWPVEHTCQENASQDRPTSARVYAFDGMEQASPIGLRKRMGLVSPALQEHYQRGGWRIHGQEVAASGFDDAYLLNRHLTPQERQRLAQVAGKCGALALLERPLSSFSQGELRLLLLVRALAPLVERPAVLLLDEGLEGLDASARGRIHGVLEPLMAGEDGDIALVLSAHRLETHSLPRGLTHVLTLDAGRIVSQGAISSPLVSLSQPTASHPPCPLPQPASEQANQRDDSSDGPLLTVENVNVYVDRVQVLHDLSWTIPAPRSESRATCHWLVTGPNGAGKSTLLRCLLGELPPAVGGRITMPLFPSVRERRRRIPLLSPALQATYTYDDTALDVVCSGFFGSIGLWDAPTPEHRACAIAWLDYLGMKELAERRLSTLSTGQARRVFLARALAPCPPLLLLDEPCAGLAPQARTHFLQTLQHLAGAKQGPVCVMVTHHREDCPPMFGHVLALDNGRAVYSGPREGCPEDWLPE